MEAQWWRGDLALDIHETLRAKELQLPIYKAHSPQLGMRRYFVNLMTTLSNHFDLCPTARHLAIYLLDFLMDHYDITVEQLHIISFVCLILAREHLIVEFRMGQNTTSSNLANLCISKFEEREGKVPKLEHLNNVAYMCNVNVALNKKDLLRMEKLILEKFDWNLCLPTPAHYIDYYLCVSIGENDFHNGWPITLLTEIKVLLGKYAYYFLDCSVQDHTFLYFRPSLIAAACVCASRICMQISPVWTTELELITCYSWEHLAQCTEMMLMCYENDVKEANNINNQVIQHQEQEAMGNLSYQATTPVPFQQSSYHLSAQHSAMASQFQSPVRDLCSAYRESLQAHRPSGRLAGSADSSLHAYTTPQAGLQPSAQTNAHCCAGGHRNGDQSLCFCGLWHRLRQLLPLMCGWVF